MRQPFSSALLFTLRAIGLKMMNQILMNRGMLATDTAFRRFQPSARLVPPSGRLRHSGSGSVPR